MRVISIDPSLRSLGMFFMEDGELNSNVIQRTEKDRLEVLKRFCLKFAREAALGWDLLIVEAYAFSEGGKYINKEGKVKSKSSSVTVQAEVGGLIRGLFGARGVPIIEVVSSTWKSVTGISLKKGTTMAESDYINAVVKKYGIRFQTVDECDAFLMYETVRLAGIMTWKSGTGSANLKARLEELRIDTSTWPTSYGKVQEGYLL